MQIIFLGTGGGRNVLINQLRGTGGFRLVGSRIIHCDPGPGALLRCKQFGQNPEKVDIIAVSHNHLDHANDANLLVEAMTECGKRRRGAVVASVSVLEGNERFDRALTRYHEVMAEKIFALRAYEKAEFGSVTITATTTAHGDEEGVGLIIEMDGVRVGYSGHTEYFEEMGKEFEGCDALIMNTLQPSGGKIPTHFGTDGAVRLLKALERKPKVAIIQHFGMGMLKAGPETEAAAIQEATGVRTVAAKDGMAVPAGETEKKAGEKKLTEFEG